jgi:anti-sigma factor RsiW
MRDCPNAEMRDLLPDLLHGRGDVGRLAEARAHVATCDACRAELELLRALRSATVVEASTDVGRIAAAIPSYRQASLWRAAGRSRLLQAAAAILVLVGGATVVRESTRVAPPDSVTTASSTLASGTELPVGEALADVSDSDLRELLDELQELDAVMSEETEVVVVPSLGKDGV